MVYPPWEAYREVYTHHGRHTGRCTPLGYISECTPLGYTSGCTTVYLRMYLRVYKREREACCAERSLTYGRKGGMLRREVSLLWGEREACCAERFLFFWEKGRHAAQSGASSPWLFPFHCWASSRAPCAPLLSVAGF